MSKKIASGILGLSLFLYPFIVFFLLAYTNGVKVLGYILILFGLMRLWHGLRAHSQNHNPMTPILYMFSLMSIGFGIIVLVYEVALPAKLYPVGISMLCFVMFAHSLYSPMTIIEKIARITNPDLPDEAKPYLRKVTLVWMCFFLFNGAVATMTTLPGNEKWWLIYNGFISYILMAGLYAIEYLIRQKVKRKFDNI